MQILCTVDIRTRELYLEDVTIAAFDHLVDDVLFVIEPIDGFQLETSTIKIAAVGPLGEPHDYEIDPSTVTVDEETGNINFVWSIPVGVTAMPLTAFKISDTKNITFAVCAEIVSGDNLVKAWHSDDGVIKVKAHLEPESGGGEDPSEEATNAQKIGQLQTATAILQREISGIASGTPPTADSTEDMDPDESTVYINTTDGNWYYYDGSAWQIGGVYGGAVTSTTFNQHGVPADDFAVGEALDGLDDRVTALESGTSTGVPTSVRQAMLALFEKAAYIETGLSDEVAVVQAWAEATTSITVSPSTASVSSASPTAQLTAVTTPAGGAVTWASSNTAVATVSSAGLVTAVGNGTATIRATSGDVSVSCAVTVTGFATLTGIIAVYSGGSVTTDATLSDLTSDLVVTGSYDDSTTAVITDYTLSGTLSAGTSTITVSYGGFTDTFTVTVTETALYPLPDIARTAVTGDITVEVTNGNHVKVIITASSRGPYIYAASAQGAFYTNRGTLFEVPAGASWETEVTNISFSGNNSADNYFAAALKPSSSESFGSSGGIHISTTGDGTLEDVSISGTAESATTIYCLLIFAYRSVTIEFDYKFRVNGTRYI